MYSINTKLSASRPAAAVKAPFLYFAMHSINTELSAGRPAAAVKAPFFILL